MNFVVEHSHVLWHNSDHSVCLLDGPGSIVDAQGPRLKAKSYTLLSSSPRGQPFASQEPKSEPARQRLLSTLPAQDLHDGHAELLEYAISQTKDAYTGPWLLPRAVSQDSQAVAKSRTADDHADILLPVGEALDNIELQDDWPFVHNSNEDMTLSLQDNTHFFFPALSTFMLADCMNKKMITSFHAHVRNQASENGTPWRFDCIIMDPPWSNRSVKRKRSSYNTAEAPDVANMLHSMDIDRLMGKECLVGVWITNKASVRESILGECGLFQSWGVELIEEWLWLKVTTQGEPVSGMRALWRKPYEVLLLGRRRDLLESHTGQLRQRILISVPDTHSRKPCLKSLIEPMLAVEHRVLEIFARHLVTGWWSWGNECTKFNKTDQWCKHQV